MATDGAKLETPTRKVNPLGLGLFLSGTLLVSVFILALNSRGFLNVLGWSKSPGYLILLGLLLLGLFAIFRREPVLQVAILSALFVITICLDLIYDVIRLFADIFPLPTPMWLFLAFVPLLVGCSYVYRMRLPLFAKVGYQILGGYIGSVYMYNGFHSGQYMSFFGGGWTA